MTDVAVVWTLAILGCIAFWVAVIWGVSVLV